MVVSSQIASEFSKRAPFFLINGTTICLHLLVVNDMHTHGAWRAPCEASPWIWNEIGGLSSSEDHSFATGPFSKKWPSFSMTSCMGKNVQFNVRFQRPIRSCFCGRPTTHWGRVRPRLGAWILTGCSHETAKLKEEITHTLGKREGYIVQAFNDSWREETQNRRRIITVQSQQMLVMPHHRHIRREVGTTIDDFYCLCWRWNKLWWNGTCRNTAIPEMTQQNIQRVLGVTSKHCGFLKRLKFIRMVL